jgi:phosphate transport system permease protein
MGAQSAIAQQQRNEGVAVARPRPLPQRIAENLFRGLLVGSILVALGVLVFLLIDVFRDGAPRLDSRLWTEFPSRRAEQAGAQSAIFGTLWVMGIVAVTCLPIGIGAAIYLEEYADQNHWYNRLIALNIQNLAAVPSIVYGILGLAFFARGWFTLGRTVLTAALTLSLLVLPVVIITAREAIRAVPREVRDGALALGATQWQTTSRQVLPAAIPGIATGTILALSRAIGEAAPLLLLGALTFITFNPDGLDSQFTVLPIQIYGWISEAQEEYRVLAAALIVVLLVILLLMNSVAIYLRNRYSRQR